MYFPLLKNKQNELLAVQESTSALLASGNVFPVFELVRADERPLDAIANTGQNFGVIVNPHRGPLRNTGLTTGMRTLILRPEVLPIMRVKGKDRPQDINQFASRWPPRRGFLLTGHLTVATEAAIIATNPEYVLIQQRAGRVRTARPLTGLGRDRHVIIEENFNVQSSSRLYPADELFTDRNHTIASNPDFAHFGDFSIFGNRYSQGGQGAYAIAAHHVYKNGTGSSPLHVSHYVSTYQQNVQGNEQPKIQQAVGMLVADLPRFSALNLRNSTTVCTVEYPGINSSAIMKTAGLLKRLALKHHLLLMTRI